MLKHNLIGAGCVVATFLFGAGLATGESTGQAGTGGVDYTAMTPEALAEHLEDTGYVARPFFAPEPALAALGEEDPAVLITDLRMDGMDGMDRWT